MKKLVAALLALTSITAISPTTADAGGRCSKYEHLLVQHAPRGGWDVARMSGYMYRESRCLPAVVNARGGDTGLLQIHPINWSYLSRKFGVTVNRAWLQNPANNVRAAAQLCRYWRYAGRSCYQPWRTS
jgi:hypothetical protein